MVVPVVRAPAPVQRVAPAYRAAQAYRPPVVRATAPAPAYRAAQAYRPPVVRATAPAPAYRAAQAYRPPVASPLPARRPIFAPLPAPSIAAPPRYIPPFIPPVIEPPVGGGVLPFRRPRKQMRQRRGGGDVDLLDFEDEAGLPPPSPPPPPVIIAPADPTQPGGPFDPNRYGAPGQGPITDSPIDYDYDTSVEDGGEPYTVIEGSEMESDAGNVALPESAEAQSDDPTMGDVFADARAWMASVNPVNRATITASALLDRFNAFLHQAQNAVSNFFGQERLYDRRKADSGKQLFIADEIVGKLRAKGRYDDAQRVLTAAALLQSNSSPVRIDSTNQIIKARIKEFNSAYAGNGVGLGESVSFSLAAQLISILNSLITYMIPGGYAMSDFIHRTGSHLTNLVGVMTGMLSAAEYGEIEARSRERFTFTTIFKGVAGVALIGAAIYLYWKWKKK